MAEFIQFNLQTIISELGEDRAKSILSDFSCPKNRDVEDFLKNKAIEFSKQSLSKTQLIFYKEETEMHLVGYFTLSQKTITVAKSALSSKMTSKMRRFSKYDTETKRYTLPVILIGQIGKNYQNNNNKLIKGNELLEMAFRNIDNIQSLIGGRFIYLECEDKEKLLNFYIEQNGFQKFGKRKLDGDETNLQGKYLIQLIRYMKNK